jgi:hypothetical protein
MVASAMHGEAALEELWQADDHYPLPRFDPASVEHLPPAARRWLLRVIEPGTPLYRAIRLRMHGEINLSGWHEFSAEQVIRWGRGLIWQAKVALGPLTIKGHDAVIDGIGEMRWKLLGLIPVMMGRGPDIDRSAAARLELESVMLPTVLVDDVDWHAGADDRHARVRVRVPGDEAELALGFDERGGLHEVSCPRWGNPGGGEFRFEPFGGYWDDERTVQGCTIATRMRAGWYFGTERYAGEGEFFRGQIDAIQLR